MFTQALCMAFKWPRVKILNKNITVLQTRKSARVYMPAEGHMYGCEVWRLAVKARCLSSGVIIAFSETGTSTDQYGWLVNEPQESFCQCLHSAGITRVCYNTPLFHTAPGDSTHLQLSAFLTELSPQPAWKPLLSIQCAR